LAIPSLDGIGQASLKVPYVHTHDIVPIGNTRITLFCLSVRCYSKGRPDVLSEINGIDGIMHYALDQLKFRSDHIVLFAWSIGGYAACWTSAHYPNIRGLLLDATFDDILPLAKQRMPTCLSGLVETTIRQYFNLNNVNWLRSYDGPFYVIRRTRDQVVSLANNRLMTNRANEILFDILVHRYPYIYHDERTKCLLRQTISSIEDDRTILQVKHAIDIKQLDMQMRAYRTLHPIVTYPCRFGSSM
jgi:hypothetical protein